MSASTRHGVCAHLLGRVVPWVRVRRGHREMPRTWRFRSPAHDCHLLYASPAPAQGSRTAPVVVYRPSAPPPTFRLPAVSPLDVRCCPSAASVLSFVLPSAAYPTPRLLSTSPLSGAASLRLRLCILGPVPPSLRSSSLSSLYNSPATRTTTRPCNRSCRPTVKSRTGIRAPRVPRSFTALVSVSSSHAVSTIPSHGAVAYHHRRPSAHPSICPSTHSASIPPPTVWPLRALVSAVRSTRPRCLPLVPV